MSCAGRNKVKEEVQCQYDSERITKSHEQVAATKVLVPFLSATKSRLDVAEPKGSELLLDFLLMKDIWHLRHPLFTVGAPELPFWRQLARPIQRARHHISEVVFGPLSELQDPASASWTEFAMQEGAATVVGFVNSCLNN